MQNFYGQITMGSKSHVDFIYGRSAGCPEISKFTINIYTKRCKGSSCMYYSCFVHVPLTCNVHVSILVENALHNTITSLRGGGISINGEYYTTFLYNPSPWGEIYANVIGNHVCYLVMRINKTSTLRHIALSTHYLLVPKFWSVTG